MKDCEKKLFFLVNTFENDIFAKNKYPAIMETVKSISENDKAGVNKNKAKLVLEKINK